LVLPQEEVTIDNNGSYILFIQLNSETQLNETIRISIKSVLDYKIVAGNAILINYQVEGDNKSTLLKELTVNVKLINGESADEAAKRFFAALDSAINIYFYFWLTEHRGDLLTTGKEKEQEFSDKDKVPMVYKYPLKTMKMIYNEIAQTANVSCIEINEKVNQVAEDFAMGNAII